MGIQRKSCFPFLPGTLAPRSALILFVVCPAAFTSVTVAAADGAQAYPSKPIRLIVPGAPGSGGDVMARTIANELTRQMAQQVVIDNRAGASGIIAFEAIAKAPADGYTFGSISGALITNPSLFAKLPYDSAKDFQPLIHQNTTTHVLTVSPALPVRSTQELINYARAHPGKLSAGYTSMGGIGFLGLELFKQMTNTEIVQIPYKAMSQAITEAIAGQIHIVAEAGATIVPHVRAGRVIALAVMTPKRSPFLPDIPTIAEGGVPGFGVASIGGYILPAHTPRGIVLRLNAEINKALKSSGVVANFSATGYTIEGGTPEQFGAVLRSETVKWAGVIKAAGIKPE